MKSLNPKSNKSPVLKHQTKCNDCGFEFFLEDADWCIHYYTTGKGTKECPQCHNCICHGQTSDEIQTRFDSNIKKGKFVECKPNQMGWDYMCKTVKEVKVKDG